MSTLRTYVSCYVQTTTISKSLQTLQSQPHVHTLSPSMLQVVKQNQKCTPKMLSEQAGTVSWSSRTSTWESKWHIWSIFSNHIWHTYWRMTISFTINSVWDCKGLIMLLRFSKNAEEGTPSSPWNALCVLSVSPRRAFDGLTCTSWIF